MYYLVYFNPSFPAERKPKGRENDIVIPPNKPSGLYTPQEKREKDKKTSQDFKMSHQDV